MNDSDNMDVKVPAVTAGFWLLKVLVTTLGETGGDAVSMSMNLGYLYSSIAFAVVFLCAVAWQVSRHRFNARAYWFCIVATTTVGTTLADFADRSLGIGYAGGTALLLAALLSSLLFLKHATGSVAVGSIYTRRAEAHYWLVILCSQTLGTALGDWTADSLGMGYTGGAAVFAALLVLVFLLYRFSSLSRAGLFWAAFILTRPLGAVVGDFLDKPLTSGGLAISRYTASGILVALVVLGVLLLPQRPEGKSVAVAHG